MTPDDEARMARLKATRDRLEAQLKDPRTPPYSVAPLSNQLRLADKEIERIQRREDADHDGLPTTPDRADFIHFMRYGYVTRRPLTRRQVLNEYGQREQDIFDEWRSAGFELLPRPPRDLPPGVDRREAIEEWVEVCRAELVRCLERNEAKR